MSIFEKATRFGVRFDSTKGQLSTEDLWQLPLTSKNGVSLDSIAVALYRSLQQDANVSFVNSVNTTNSITQLKFDVVKHIIDVRKADNEAAAIASAEAAKRQKIMSIIDAKKDQALTEMSVADLEKMI